MLLLLRIKDMMLHTSMLHHSGVNGYAGASGSGIGSKIGTDEYEAHVLSVAANIDYAFLMMTPIGFLIFNAVYWSEKVGWQ